MTSSQISLLCKGPKYCPSTKGNYIQIKADTKEFTRKLKLREKFWESEYDDDSLVKHPSDYNPGASDNEFRKIITTIEHMDPTQVRNFSDNLTRHERVALSELRDLCNNEVILKKADKGNTLVMMDREYYRDKLVLSDHLNTSTYRISDLDSDIHVHHKLTELMVKHQHCLTKKEFSYVVDFEWKTSNFYALPKIHKSKQIIDKLRHCDSEYIEMSIPSDLQARPVVAGPVSPTQHLSEFLEKILSPIVEHLQSYVKDDWDFLRKFPRHIPPDHEIYTCDIVSLYTSIRHDLGLKALKFWVTKYRHLVPARISIDFILEAADFVLNNNYFQFDGLVYLQLIGTAIGTKFAPPYACLTCGYLEVIKLYPALEMSFEKAISDYIIELFFRYMDDGIVPIPKQVNMELLENILQNLDPDIHFTLEKSSEEVRNGMQCKVIHFLDITLVQYPSGDIETDVFYKETNNHDYLHYDSHHPQHIRDNVPFNLAKRIIVFCSDPFREDQRLNELKQWLLSCGYPEKLIDSKFFRARLQGPAPAPNKNCTTIPFVTSFYSNYDARNIASTSNSLLQSSKSESVNEIFKDCRPVLALRQPPNILRQLTRAAFVSEKMENSQLTPGLFRCASNHCKLCKDGYIQECSEFTTSNGFVWEIKSHITCNSTNVIYFLKCNSCKVTTYTGKTNNLRKRMNGHKSSCVLGNSTDIFDNHVFKCRRELNMDVSPLFLVYAFLTVNDPKLLIPYENFLQQQGHDTMN